MILRNIKGLRFININFLLIKVTGEMVRSVTVEKFSNFQKLFKVFGITYIDTIERFNKII
jgi:hypothetical protein